MPTPIGHSLFGLAAYIFIEKKMPQRKDWKLLLGYTVMVNLPDIDFSPMLIMGFKAVSQFHQRFTHNIAFCAVSALLCALLWKYWRNISFNKAYFLCFGLIFSHLVLDSLGYDTNPPIGMQMFWPFSKAYMLSPVSCFIGVAKSSFGEMFSLWNALAVIVEIVVLSPLVWLSYRSLPIERMSH